MIVVRDRGERPRRCVDVVHEPLPTELPSPLGGLTIATRRQAGQLARSLLEAAMSTDPWTADDPQPGDFDVVLSAIDPAYVEYHDGDPSATLRILVSVEGEDARRLERLAEASGKSPHAVVAELLRDADRPASQRR